MFIRFTEFKTWIWKSNAIIQFVNVTISMPNITLKQNVIPGNETLSVFN